MKIFKKTLILFLAEVLMFTSSIFVLVSPASAAKITRYTNRGGSSYYYSQAGWWNLGGNVRSGYNGCGITSFAISISVLRGKKITPYSVAKAAYNKKIWNLRGNTPRNLVPRLASYSGLSSRTISKNAKTMAKYLYYGYVLVIRASGSLPFTSGGHYVTVVGARSDGYFKVVDPGHSSYRPKWVHWRSFLSSMSGPTIFALR